MTRPWPILIVLLFAPSAWLNAADSPAPVFASADVIWRTGDPAPASPSPVGRALTLLVHCRDLQGSGDLLLWNGDDARTPVRLSIGDLKGKRALLADIALNARPTPLRLSVPLDAIGANGSHDFLLRYLGYRVELFVDGVLVDEEWPLGELVPAPASIKISSSSITELALWNRALRDDELRDLAVRGGPIAERQHRYLGPPRDVGQFWRPRGLNAYAGDCMPFFDGKRFHLFYLFDRRHHASKWSLGAHQWAHVSTVDLNTWEELPMAVPINDEKEGSICTGSAFLHEGKYYAFYAVRATDGSPAPLHAATSVDGIHFQKHPPFTQLSGPYTGGSARDPVVFREARTGLFHMLVTTSLRDPAVPNRGGCLAHLVSPDLEHWEQQGPFLVPGYPGEPECPDYFEWHGWFYLVFSNQGVARYRISRDPLGPWLRPKGDAFDGPQASVMKTAGFHGDRRLGVAFLAAGGYAGDVVFREITQNRDGTLNTRWPLELVPSHAHASERLRCRLHASQGLQLRHLGTPEEDFLLRARINPAPNASFFGFRFRAGEAGRGGFELRFEPWREKVGLRPADAGSTDECEGTAIYDVSGLDQPFGVEVLLKGDIVDVCVDGRRTLVARFPGAEKALFAFAQYAEVEFANLTIESLVSNPRR